MSGLLFATEAGAVPLSHLAEVTAAAIQSAWLIPVVPAVMAAILMIFGPKIGKSSAFLAIAAIGYSFAHTVAVLMALGGQEASERTFVVPVLSWFDLFGFKLDWAMLVDPLSAVMLTLVTGVGLLIHIYSIGYMEGDERYTRFFAYLNLFAASMLILVLGSSFLTLFVGWELVGLCSYLLIGFWFENREYATAAKKAFVTNRVGDVGFMVAMFLIFKTFHSLEFSVVLPAAEAAAASGVGVLIVIGACLFVGATGKSAQIPLFVWLPDAMAGPTPVSALIHAATMVTAGVYLVARTSPIFTQIPNVGLVVAWVGALTSLLAALIAATQVDLKKILAYSTVSQLGYMFIGVGVGSYTAGVFHLLTHGFFKALLFLAAGSVMHAMANKTDVRKMGGLFGTMRFTAITSAAAVAAIAGVPGLSGFFSKESILAAAAETPGGEFIWVIGIVVAGLTAYYMTRWYMLIFLGEKRWPKGAHPHESPLTMTVPLMILAVPTVIGGLLNLNPETGFLSTWLANTVIPFHHHETWIPVAAHMPAALGAAVAGIGYAVYKYREVDTSTIGTADGLTKIAREKFYIDEIYEFFTVHLGGKLARGFARIDKQGIDGVVNGAAALTRSLAGTGRQLQTGLVRSYALGILLGALTIGAVAVATFFGGF